MEVEREVKLGYPTGAELPEPLHDLVTTETRLTTTYYDTTDLRLARFGATVRWRDDDGWTVELPPLTDVQLPERPEVRFDGDPAQPPAPVVGLVASLTRGAPVGPVARIESTRRSATLDTAALTDDEVVATDPDGRPLSSFREIELELADGAGPASVRTVIDALVAAGASDADPRPRLVQALGVRATGPADIVVPDVSERPTGREIIRAALATSIRTLVLSLPGVRLDTDPEDVHQARVAIRRLRSNLRSFKLLVERPWADHLDQELKWLAGLLGRVRDDDVTKLTIAELGLTGPGIDALLRVVETDRRAARRALLKALDGERAAALLDALVLAAADPRVAPQADDPAGDTLPRLVRKPWRRLRDAVASSGDDPEDPQLHEIRILAKRCRYTADAVRLAAGPRAGDFSKAMARIQDALGHLNDAAIITARFEGMADRLPPGAAFAAGQVSGMLLERAHEHRDEWEAAWDAADRKKLRSWFA